MVSFGFPIDAAQMRLSAVERAQALLPGLNEQYCSGCARVISLQARHCPGCGAPNPRASLANASAKSRLAAMLLCLFLGVFGVHRVYVGKSGTGALQALTLGLFGIWTLIDFILIVSGAFSDNQDRKLIAWSETPPMEFMAAEEAC